MIFPHGGEADVVEEVDEVGGEPAGAEDDHHRDAEPERGEISKNDGKGQDRFIELGSAIRGKKWHQ